jgi:hypothetical protein
MWFHPVDQTSSAVIKDVETFASEEKCRSGEFVSSSESAARKLDQLGLVLLLDKDRHGADDTNFLIVAALFFDRSCPIPLVFHHGLLL